MTRRDRDDEYGIVGSRNTTPPLFGLFATHPETSRKANERAMPHKQTKKRMILLALQSAGPRGMTRKELTELFSKVGPVISKDTVNGRCAELLKANEAHIVGTRDGEGVLHHGAKP